MNLCKSKCLIKEHDMCKENGERERENETYYILAIMPPESSRNVVILNFGYFKAFFPHGVVGLLLLYVVLERLLTENKFTFPY